MTNPTELYTERARLAQQRQDAIAEQAAREAAARAPERIIAESERQLAVVDAQLRDARLNEDAERYQTTLAANRQATDELHASLAPVVSAIRSLLNGALEKAQRSYEHTENAAVSAILPFIAEAEQQAHEQARQAAQRPADFTVSYTPQRQTDPTGAAFVQASNKFDPATPAWTILADAIAHAPDDTTRRIYQSLFFAKYGELLTFEADFNAANAARQQSTAYRRTRTIGERNY